MSYVLPIVRLHLKKKKKKKKSVRKRAPNVPLKQKTLYETLLSSNT